MEDCRQIAQGVMSLPPHGRPWVLSTEAGPGVDYQIPVLYKANSCEVRIVPRDKHDPRSESLTARYLAHEINRLINSCVAPLPHLGGRSCVGRKDLLGMIVSGIPSSENPDRDGEFCVV